MEVQEEKEFDPTVHTAEYVAVEPDESFTQIRNKIEDALRRTPNVILIIPRGAQSFHNTQDFLALGKLQWRREVRVAVATPDPTIAGLARVLGFHIVEPPADHPALAGDPALESSSAQDDHNGTIEKPTSPLPLGGRNGTAGTPDWVLSPSLTVPSYGQSSTSGSLTTSTWLSMDTDAQLMTPDGRPISRAGQPAPRKRQRQTGQLLSKDSAEIITDPSLEAANHATDVPTGEQEAIKARLAVLESNAYQVGRGWRYGGSLRRGSWVKVLVSVAIVLLLVAGAAGGYAYVYLPEGKLLVVPKSKVVAGLPVHINVSTGKPITLIGPGSTTPPEALEPGQDLVTAESLVATPIQVPLTEEGTAPATGTRQIPRGRAEGLMHFVNRTDAAQFVPEGATFEFADGVTVQTTQAGTVNPTTFGVQFGTLNLPIVANVEGPAGNIAAGKIGGIYSGVLDYVNYEIKGGTLETVKVVLQADIDKLVAELSAKVDADVNGAITANPGSGTLITQTIHLEGDKQIATIPAANQDGDSVSVKVSGLAVAYSYDEVAMDKAIYGAVYDHVQGNEPANFGAVTDPNSIEWSKPEIQVGGPENAQGIITFASTASASVKYSLTDSLALAIRTLVKGASIKDVPTLVSSSQYGNYVNVPADKIEAKVLWFSLDKLPTDTTRIEIQQPGNTGNTAITTSPRQSKSMQNLLTGPLFNPESRGDQK